MKQSKKLSEVITPKSYYSIARKAVKKGKERDNAWVKRCGNRLRDNKFIARSRTLTVSDIKDIDRLEIIFQEYLQKHFFSMCNQITDYDSFTFFRDLLIFLGERYKHNELRSATYQWIWTLYHEIITI